MSQIYRRPIDHTPIPVKFANAANPLTIATPDESGETIHPDIWDFKTSTFAGHRFWMVNTPYPANLDDDENPSIWYSDDGTTWTVPDGLTNPVVAFPGGTTYNSDPCLLFDPTVSKLKIFYRVTRPTNLDEIRVIESSDGVTWENDTLLLSFDADNRTMSPQVHYNAQTKIYSMWMMRGGSPNIIIKYTSVDGLNWSLVGKVGIKIPPTYPAFWHLNLKEYNGHLVGVMAAFKTNQNTDMSLFALESLDGLTGNVFRCIPKPLISLGATGKFDDYTFYQSCLLNVDGVWKLWYIGRRNPAGTYTNKLGLTTA